MTEEQKQAARERLAHAREVKAAKQAEAASSSEMTATEFVEAARPQAWTPADLMAVVAAGATIAEARMLRDEGYTVEDAKAVAALQREQATAAAAESQTATAKAMQKAMRPENEFHPGISALSYPEGDRARPKTLPCEFLYLGYPAHKFLETQHWREVELMAQVKPGVYTVLRKDGSRMQVDVFAEKDADGNITRLDVRFPVSRETKSLIPPMTVVLAQITSDKPVRESFIAATNEWLQMTLAGTAEAVPA